VFAIATSVLASRRPAKAMAQVPVVAALPGGPAPPKAVHRSALPGIIVFAAGLTCLAFSGGLAGVQGGPRHALLLLAGLVATIVGIVLLAPLAISVLAAGAGPRLPVAIRIALRDLVRYRGPVRRRAGGDHVRRIPGHGDLHHRQHQVRQSAELDRPEPVQQ
jgi:hypothetical protein